MPSAASGTGPSCPTSAVSTSDRRGSAASARVAGRARPRIFRSSEPARSSGRTAHTVRPRKDVPAMPAIPINRTTSVDDAELDFAFARSGGPGGQHANTSSTKVELRWDVAGSPSLTDEQKHLVMQRLGNRINAEGVLVLQSSEYR